MTVTSLYFFIFLALGVLIYYIVPSKVQWIVLLCLSVTFYCFAADPLSLIYPVSSTVVAYLATCYIDSNRNDEKQTGKCKTAAIAACMINAIIWFVIRGTALWSVGLKLISVTTGRDVSIDQSGLLVSLGIGYYTLQVISYIVDVHKGTVPPQRNILKLFLYLIFFPQLTVGPINRYSRMQGLYGEHSFSYQNLTSGAQRILWGLFKKLVISDRIAVIVTGIWDGKASYSLIWVWAAVLLYTFQLYTDFSGCMDIVIGAAGLFDIEMTENFKSPFYATTIREFWQRWHISLSDWLRDYIYIPLGGNRKGQRRKYLNLLVSLLVSGLWHGSVQTVIFFGLFLGAVMIGSDILAPAFDKIDTVLRVKKDSFGWKLFQRFRTYTLFGIGVMCFSAEGLKETLVRFRYMFLPSVAPDPWTLFDGTILNTGVTWQDINIILVGFLLVMVVDMLREKYGSARIWISSQGIIFRWGIWLMLLVAVVILGHYGPEYDASHFIYQGF